MNKTNEHTQPSLLAWDDMSPAETALLSRVEANILDRDPAPSHDQMPAPQGHGIWKPLAVIGCCAAVALLWWQLNTTPLQPLQTEGMIHFQSLSRSAQSTTPTQIIRLHPKARIGVAQQWRAQSIGQSQMTLQRKSEREVQLRLRDGALSIYVKPGSMKRFVVRCHKHLKVIVKGTRFLVWKHGTHTRVEVTTGHVLLRDGAKELLHLYKGQGAKLSADTTGSMRFTTYKLPSSGGWLAKTERLASQQPALLFSYVKALAHQKMLPSQRRKQVIETAAHALAGKKQWHQAMKLWLLLFRLQATKATKQDPQQLDAQTALFQAAQTCRRAKRNQRQCIALFQQWRKRYPRGLHSLKAASLFWIGALQLRDPAQAARGKQTIQQYLEAHPKGIHAHKARILRRAYSAASKP